MLWDKERLVEERKMVEEKGSGIASYGEEVGLMFLLSS